MAISDFCNRNFLYNLGSLGDGFGKLHVDGVFKLNVDGSFISSLRMMGVGGVLRDSTGAWLWGFFWQLGLWQ
ncbi:hypothetical protein SESBI_10832 [Sesbania bispinosa]|nr:hypothetical protein SESBI_10832 [Sesbania bispinosa]